MEIALVVASMLISVGLIIVVAVRQTPSLSADRALFDSMCANANDASAELDLRRFVLALCASMKATR